MMVALPTMWKQPSPRSWEFYSLERIRFRGNGNEGIGFSISAEFSGTTNYFSKLPEEGIIHPPQWLHAIAGGYMSRVMVTVNQTSLARCSAECQEPAMSHVQCQTRF
jgi:hypothetical protein